MRRRSNDTRSTRLGLYEVCVTLGNVYDKGKESEKVRTEEYEIRGRSRKGEVFPERTASETVLTK